MRPDSTRRNLAEDLAAGRGAAQIRLARLSPGARDRALLNAITSVEGCSRLGESRRGAYHARLVARHGSPDLPARLLERIEADLMGSDEGFHGLCVLVELARRGLALPPLPFLRIVQSGEELYWKLPAFRALAMTASPGLLRAAVDATVPVLEDPFDAKDWGEATALGGPETESLLLELLSCGVAMARLGAAFGLVAGQPEGPVLDARRETLADLMAFDSDPIVRVHALEVREDSSLSDPYAVASRLLLDPAVHGFLESWHWSLAAEALPSSDLPAALRALDEGREAGSEAIAEVLGESGHPLAVPLLRSRVLEGSDHDRIWFLRALEYLDQEITEDELALFDEVAPPTRVLVLRARGGRPQALDHLARAVAEGAVGPGDLSSEEDELVQAALVPRVLTLMDQVEPGARARLLRVFRERLPADLRRRPGGGDLHDPDPEIAREAALDLAQDPAQHRDALAAFLRTAPDESRVATVEVAAEADPGTARELLRMVLADASPRVRSEAVRVLARTVPREEAAHALRAHLDDDHAAVRTEALAALTQRGETLSLDQLAELLEDSCGKVRALAAELLTAHPGPDTVDRLASALRDEDLPWLRRALEEHLQRLRSGRDTSAAS